MAMVTADPSTPAAMEGQAVGGFSLRDLLVQWFYNSGLIFACLLGGLVVGLLAAALSPKLFTANSLLLVLPPPVNSLAPGAVGGPAASEELLRVVQSDVQILQSDLVIQGAVERTGPASFASRGLPFLGPHGPPSLSDAMERFKKNLHVSVDTGSTVIRLTYSSPDRALAIRSLQALIDSFQTRRAALMIGDGAAAGGPARYQADLARIDGRIQQLEAAHNVVDLPQDTQLANTRQDAVAQRLNQARERMAQVTGELGATSTGIASAPSQVLASRESTNASANDDARNTLLRLRQDRAHLATQYTDAWPGLRELDAKIAQAQTQISQNSQNRFFTDRSARNPLLDQLDGRLASLKIERRSLADEIPALQAEQAAVAARLAELRDVSGQLRDLQRQRDVADSIFRQLSTSQAGAALADQASGTGGVRVAQPPSAPMRGHTLAPTLVIAGVLLGLIAAVVASGIASLGRQVFITPNEAARALRLPVLANFDARASKFRSKPGRAAIGRFATLLVDASVGGKLLQVIQIVSTETDVKSDFALELGHAMAADQSQRTLLIDLDAEARYKKLVRPGGVVRQLSAGRGPVTVARSSNAKLWLTLDARTSPFGDPRLPLAEVQASLDAIKPHFDRILVVAQRDFSQYAARRLYPLADANVLLVRAEKTRSPAARQLKETVLGAGGDILGFVFTHRGYYIPEALYRWL